MSFKDQTQPILILNFIFDDHEVKKCEIHSFGDATIQIQSFCTAHGIKSKEVVEGIRNRVAACLLYQGSYVESRQNENIAPHGNKDATTDKKDISKHNRTKSRKLTIETSPRNTKTNCVVHTTKATNTAGKGNGTVQGKGHQLIKSLAESVKTRLFTSKTSKLNENVENKLEKNPESIKYQEPETHNNQDNIFDEAEPEDLFQKTLESNTEIEIYTESQAPIIKPTKEPFTCADYKSEAKVPRKGSFIKSLADSTNLDNTKGSHLNRNRMVKKSSFYEYSITDSKFDRNIYDNFNEPQKLKRLQTASTASFEQEILKRVSMPEIKSIFNKLDAESYGHIGPKKMDLRSLSSVQLNNMEPVIAEILTKDGDVCLNFKDFCKIVGNFMLID